MLGIDLCRIDTEALLGRRDQAEQADQRHRDALDDQHDFRREPDILPGAIEIATQSAKKRTDEAWMRIIDSSVPPKIARPVAPAVGMPI